MAKIHTLQAKITHSKIVLAGIAAMLVGVILIGGNNIAPAANALAGTPDAVDDSLIMYQSGGPVTINWIANDDMDDNAALDSFDAMSVNGGTVTDAGNGTFEYTPLGTYSGGDGFTYTICDDDVLPECDTASVSITIVAVSQCLTGFYQVLSGEINVLDTTSSPASYVSASVDLGELNATGYNPNDGLIYGFSSSENQIISFNPATSVFTNVESETGNFNAGDVDSSNNLYYNQSNDTNLNVYNTVTDTTSSIALSSAHATADFAYVPSVDKFYGMQKNGDNMAVIDLNAAPTNVTTIATSGPITSETGGFGAAWVTDGTTLYVFNNNSGNIFSVDTATGASTLITSSAPSGNNDGMSCAAGASPFDITSILDYGDAPDTYSTLLASTGASAVVNTSYRIGNFIEIDADGLPTSNATGDDTDDIGNDEDGVRIGLNRIDTDGERLYQVEQNTVLVDVPLGNGFVSMWLDNNNDGVFANDERVATDVAPVSGVATLTFTTADTTTVPFDTFARVRLAARTGGTPTGLFSFGEVEDYAVTVYPSRPTITNDTLPNIASGGDSAYTVTGVCTDDGDSVVVTIGDGVNPDVLSAAVACSGGVYSRTLDVSGLDDGTLTVTSTIDDTYNDPVSDVDTLQKDVLPPTITQAVPPAISASNDLNYTVTGTCTADTDAITVTLTDSDSPSTMVSDTTTCSSGTYSVAVDASGLMDGSVDVESEINDGINTPVSDSDTVSKDAAAPTINQTAPANITNATQASYTVTGTCTADTDAITVTLTDSDSPSTMVSDTTTCSSGTYSVAVDASGLMDGSVDVESEINDGINTPVSDSDTVSKDATVPTVAHSALTAASASTSASYAVAGVCTQNGDSVIVSITDGINSTVDSAAQVCTNGEYAVVLDISTLNDGAVTITSAITDALGNAATDTDIVTKDSSAPTITLDTPVAIDKDTITAYPISGTCSAVGDVIVVSIEDSSLLSTTAVGACVDDGGAGVYSIVVDATNLQPGELQVRATITDAVNPAVTVTDTVVLQSDLDDDDTTSAVEQAAPNDGDGNDDGVPDYLQDSVTSKINPVIDAYVTTEAVGTCSELKAVNFTIEPDLAAQDLEYDYELGFHGFEADCTALGGSVTVTHYWDQEYDTSEWQYRKFLSSSNTYIDIEQAVTYGIATIDGTRVTTATFTVTDGGPYDADGIVNGRIVDPVGPGVAPIVLSDTGLPAALTLAVGVSIVTFAAVSTRQYK